MSETASNFTVSGPLNEFLMLGNVATLINEAFTCEPVTGTLIDNAAAQAALHQEHRMPLPPLAGARILRNRCHPQPEAVGVPVTM